MTETAQHCPVEELRLPPSGPVPNNPELPVVLMRGAISECASAIEVCALFEANGWEGTWVWSVFDFHHFHPNAHEVLGVARGWATILLGGQDGEVTRIRRGDVAVLPSGTGHCRIDSSPDFAICGGYPPGQSDYETSRCSQAGDGERIAAVPIPATDPVFGAEGPLIAAWTS